ncbi:MAG: adenosylcobalamin-dependent ribonucleoside-diphosphate reductase [Candidatus Aenigmatarchaeota archaeon]
MITSVRKRDGKIVPFEPKRIEYAIHRALFDAKIRDGKNAKNLAKKVVDILEKKNIEIPSVELIQDVVESVLTKWKPKVGKIYGDYRQKKAEIREAREKYGIEAKLSYNAMVVLEQRYLLRDEKGQIIEKPGDMFRRVARAVADVEKKYGGDTKKVEEEFFNMMSRLEFLPNSPTLFNAGAPLGQLSACFVLPVDDSLESIFEAAKRLAIIEQSGGGVGFSFSRLRPKGDIVRSTMGVASGPVSFMRVFDTITDVIKAGGKRRGAMMGVLSVHHPDIEEFIEAKSDPTMLKNFNLSVAVSDKFMQALTKNGEYDIINPRTNQVVKRLPAKKIWDMIVKSAWERGDPGLLFIDEINRKNPTKHIGQIEGTNPCGELPLHPYESCNLGSINLTKMLEKKGEKYEIDWEKLSKTVKMAVRFLDDVIDANRYPFPEIERMTKANRRIGLGVMGFADMLFLMKIPYDSEKAIELAERLMKFISTEARKESEKLGEERGSFPNFKGSLWEQSGYKTMRNATTTVIAPTGSISIISGCSSGIEPVFALSYVRKILGGRELLESNWIFERVAKERGFYSAELMFKIAQSGSIQGFKEIPADVRRVFKTALDIKPAWHVRVQAAFQKYVDSSVSKTINFPHSAKPADFSKAFMLAYKSGCKGITAYRYGSKPEQVFYIKPMIKAEAEYAGGCPGICPL